LPIDPSPDNKPLPAPDVVPQKTSKAVISIVEDAPNRPPDVVKVLNDFSLWEGYRQRGHTVRIWNGGEKPSPEPDAVADATIIKSAGTGLPGLVIRDKTNNSVLYSGKLPTTSAEVLSLVGKYVQ